MDSTKEDSEVKEKRNPFVFNHTEAEIRAIYEYEKRRIEQDSPLLSPGARKWITLYVIGIVVAVFFQGREFIRELLNSAITLLVPFIGGIVIFVPITLFVVIVLPIGGDKLMKRVDSFVATFLGNDND